MEEVLGRWSAPGGGGRALWLGDWESVATGTVLGSRAGVGTVGMTRWKFSGDGVHAEGEASVVAGRSPQTRLRSCRPRLMSGELSDLRKELGQ